MATNPGWQLIKVSGLGLGESDIFSLQVVGDSPEPVVGVVASPLQYISYTDTAVDAALDKYPVSVVNVQFWLIQVVRNADAEEPSSARQ
jgi:hypothetical protein